MIFYILVVFMFAAIGISVVVAINAEDSEIFGGTCVLAFFFALLILLPLLMAPPSFVDWEETKTTYIQFEQAFQHEDIYYFKGEVDYKCANPTFVESDEQEIEIRKYEKRAETFSPFRETRVEITVYIPKDKLTDLVYD